MNPRYRSTLSGCFVCVATVAVASTLTVELNRVDASYTDPPLIDTTTIEDFFQEGTQPDPTGMELLPIADSGQCSFCHGGFEGDGLPIESEPYRAWIGSMMGNSARDPIFYACLTIANQDIAFGGDLCLRCHTPSAWLGGRSVPTDGSAMIPNSADFDGVNCNFCHRLVNPDFGPESPAEDIPILMALENDGILPAEPGTGRYIVDPDDTRRGPFGLAGQDPDVGDPLIPFNPHPEVFPGTGQPPIVWSRFHSSSELCATCHDVSNPVYVLNEDDGSYDLAADGMPHPTQDKFDMFPVERTYSEWQQSTFADGGVQMNGRFGGNHPTGVMESCQDCHMPDQVGFGCRVPGFPERQNVPQHAFNGGNNWVIRAIKYYYEVELGTPVPDLTDDVVDESIARAEDMLRNASDTEVTQDGSIMTVRITNFSGHKLPTGYHEGRRMWINVKFMDDADNVVAERGHYDMETAELVTADTKVYEAIYGLDADAAAASGLPEGPSNHFILNNTILFDNRIPPLGFTNDAFAAVQAAPVGYVYEDGQNWDDTEYNIPGCATKAMVTVFFQVTSKEYIEFLRDENKTDDTGQLAYDLWVMFGKSMPVDMDSLMIEFDDFRAADLNGDGNVGPKDLAQLLDSWGDCGEGPCAADINCDGNVGPRDLAALLDDWGKARP